MATHDDLAGRTRKAVGAAIILEPIDEAARLLGLMRDGVGVEACFERRDGFFEATIGARRLVISRRLLGDGPQPYGPVQGKRARLGVHATLARPPGGPGPVDA